jgi:hypothetical protein
VPRCPTQSGGALFLKHTRIIVTHFGGPDVVQVVEEDISEPYPIDIDEYLIDYY